MEKLCNSPLREKEWGGGMGRKRVINNKVE